MWSLCDTNILIYCDRNQQIKRLMNRDNIDQKQAILKVDKQIDIEKKKLYISKIIQKYNYR